MLLNVDIDASSGKRNNFLSRPCFHRVVIGVFFVGQKGVATGDKFVIWSGHNQECE